MFLPQKLHYNCSHVSGRIIVQQEEILLLSLLRTNHLNSLAQPIHNTQIILEIYNRGNGNKFLVNNAVNIKKSNEHCLQFQFCDSHLLRSRRTIKDLFCALSFCGKFILIIPSLITHNDFFQKRIAYILYLRQF